MIRIERADISNAKDIARLNIFVQKLHTRAYPHIFKPAASRQSVEQFFEKLLADEQNYFYLAFIKNRPVGYIWSRLEQRAENTLMYERRRLYIHHISVDESYRGQGIGTSLLDEVMSLSSSKGIETMALDTWTFNEEAYNFFKKRGFEEYNIQMWRSEQNT